MGETGRWQWPVPGVRAVAMSVHLEGEPSSGRLGLPGVTCAQAPEPGAGAQTARNSLPGEPCPCPPSPGGLPCVVCGRGP